MEDTKVQDELDKICSDNDKDDLFIEWGKEAMIKGLSHILVYQDEESHTKMMRVSPEDEDERKAKLTERVKGMKKLFDAEVAKEVAKAKAEFLKGSTPATGSTKGGNAGETKYDQYKKTGNVKGMISEKLSAHRNKEDEE